MLLNRGQAFSHDFSGTPHSHEHILGPDLWHPAILLQGPPVVLRGARKFVPLGVDIGKACVDLRAYRRLPFRILQKQTERIFKLLFAKSFLDNIAGLSWSQLLQILGCNASLATFYQIMETVSPGFFKNSQWYRQVIGKHREGRLLTEVGAHVAVVETSINHRLCKKTDISAESEHAPQIPIACMRQVERKEIRLFVAFQIGRAH